MRSLFVVAGVLITFCVVPALADPTIYDLTDSSAEATINGAIFSPFDPEGATGTGNFEPFVRIQQNGIESGYNTGGEVEFDTKGGTWTHSLLISDVPPLQVGDTWYREFLLDIDQVGGEGRLLSLDELIISLEATGDLTGYPGNFSGPIVYDLNPGIQDNSILMDAKLLAGPGNGTGDIRVLIPDDAFIGPNQYVYLFSVLGEQAGAAANDGFEEWGILPGDGRPPIPPEPPVPVPGAVLLSGLGVGLVGWLRRRKML